MLYVERASEFWKHRFCAYYVQEVSLKCGYWKPFLRFHDVAKCVHSKHKRLLCTHFATSCSLKNCFQ